MLPIPLRIALCYSELLKSSIRPTYLLFHESVYRMLSMEEVVNYSRKYNVTVITPDMGYCEELDYLLREDMFWLC